MTQHWELALLLQRGLTVALSGYNAFFFAGYMARSVRRKLGAFVLMLVNLAIGIESLTIGLLPVAFSGHDRIASTGQAIATSLSLAVALAIAVLVVRQQLKKR